MLRSDAPKSRTRLNLLYRNVRNRRFLTNEGGYILIREGVFCVLHVFYVVTPHALAMEGVLRNPHAYTLLTPRGPVGLPSIALTPPAMTKARCSHLLENNGQASRIRA